MSAKIFIIEDESDLVQALVMRLTRLSQLATKEIKKPLKIAKLVLRSSPHRLFSVPCCS